MPFAWEILRWATSTNSKNSWTQILKITQCARRAKPLVARPRHWPSPSKEKRFRLSTQRNRKYSKPSQAWHCRNAWPQFDMSSLDTYSEPRPFCDLNGLCDSDVTQSGLSCSLTRNDNSAPLIQHHHPPPLLLKQSFLLWLAQVNYLSMLTICCWLNTFARLFFMYPNKESENLCGWQMLGRGKALWKRWSNNVRNQIHCVLYELTPSRKQFYCNNIRVTIALCLVNLEHNVAQIILHNRESWTKTDEQHETSLQQINSWFATCSNIVVTHF